MQRKLFLSGILISIPLCFLLLWFSNIHCHWSDPAYKERIWLHRANTPQKLMEFADEYNGFECDVTLRDDSVFDITHDLHVSYGISAESYFQLLQGNHRRIWFDFKNLSVHNMAVALTRLENWCYQYGIAKDRFIIEGKDPVALGFFRKAGFYTSYYIRDVDLQDLTPAETEALGQRLNQIAESGQVDALSFYSRYYDIVKQVVTPSVDLLTWAHHQGKEMLSILPWRRRLFQDPQVKVILVKDKGHYHK